MEIVFQQAFTRKKWFQDCKYSRLLNRNVHRSCNRAVFNRKFIPEGTVVPQELTSAWRCLPIHSLWLWVCYMPGSDSFKTPGVCCFIFMVNISMVYNLGVLGLSSRSWSLGTRRQGLLTTVEVQKPATNERTNEIMIYCFPKPQNQSTMLTFCTYWWNTSR